MGSYAKLRVGDLEVAVFKNDIEASVALIFTTDDWRSRPATAAELEYYGEDEPWEVTELVCSLAVVRDRLELTGADWHTTEKAFNELVEWKLEILQNVRVRMSDESIRGSIAREIEYLSDFRLDDWVQAVVSAPPDPPATSRLELGTRGWLMDLWEEGDIRLCLRAAVECRRDALVTLDATDLIGGGWLSSDHDPRESALLQFGWAQIHASPIVVLTEGRTDAKILESALAVIYPHLQGFIRFADFSHRPEANAAALVRTLKGFAAAGIANRVVALFDADSAAYDAVRSLKEDKLPWSIRVLHLPNTELASAYPTVGPGGPELADVNSKACSIELYLGRDVLTDQRGELRPVRWTSFIRALQQWQGEVEGKAEIQEAFWAKAKAALNDPRTVGRQDWADLRAVIDHVRTAFAQPS
jgi:hypothetical protein